MLSFGISVTLANTIETVEPPNEAKARNVTDPQFKTDSTEVNESAKTYNPETAELGNFSSSSNTLSTDPELTEVENTSSSSSNVPAKNSYYENDEESDESSQSMISFNFLYYLFQKFKLSNSLGY